MSETKLPPQVGSIEAYSPIDIEIVQPVHAYDALDYLEGEGDNPDRYISWRRRRPALEFARSIKQYGEKSVQEMRRDAIEKVVGIGDGTYGGNLSYLIALEGLNTAVDEFKKLQYDDSLIATQGLIELAKQRRLIDCQEQTDQLNRFIAEDPDLFVLLLRKGSKEYDDDKERLARLRGLALTAVKDEEVHENPVPALLISGSDEAIGLVPDLFYPFGIYVRL